MVKIGLIGFGKTGKSVASVLLKEKTMELKWVLRKSAVHETSRVSKLLAVDSTDTGMIHSMEDISLDELLKQSPVDYIVDFSTHKNIYTYAEIAARRNIGIISAVSSYLVREKLFLKEMAKKTVVFWSPNITIGVNYLMFAAKMLRKLAPFADVQIVEEHFKGKGEISGTAVRMADSLGVDRSQISSIRVGGIVGRHQIIFGFPHQTVRLTHESISREAFGSGIVFIIKHLSEKQNGFFTFEDIIAPYFLAEEGVIV